jgi:hypothetical protein
MTHRQVTPTPFGMRNLWALVVLAIHPALPIQAQPQAPRAAQELLFDPEQFFIGRTHGEGCLKVMFSGCRHVTVEGRGHIENQDTLVLDQIVTEANKPAKYREWKLQKISASAYSGTLTDARGPTTADVEGAILHVKFPMKKGLRAEQWLTRLPDGRSVVNHMVFRKFGMVVATLDETITKIAD